ncbi:unnamed protein product [Acanthoscelides obtectus]|uniref:Uncharacterized protein n=1 Tax=Acanthoscelides obtectus TaxID=200917 RepID=A0A9P0NZI3_ACAOB|nr:unnamed protein product [Acanthoscelides obtectus]CAK1627446.1 hypothetical protein AOBTE_LOCUS4608 [Acanthoscelides obtectus]
MDSGIIPNKRRLTAPGTIVNAGTKPVIHHLPNRSNRTLAEDHARKHHTKVKLKTPKSCSLITDKENSFNIPLKNISCYTVPEATRGPNCSSNSFQEGNDAKRNILTESDLDCSDQENNIDPNGTFSIATPGPIHSNIQFDQSANETKKISTDSDIEFGHKMRPRKRFSSQSQTRLETNTRKSVRFMPTKTVIHSSRIQDMTPGYSVKKSSSEASNRSKKLSDRKSTPFVKRSKSSAITIDSNTSSSVSGSEPELGNKSSLVPRYCLRSGSMDKKIPEESLEDNAVEANSTKHKNKTPKKVSCIDLVTPNPKAHQSLKREGTFIVDSPSIVAIDYSTRIDESMNETNTTKQQRKRWDRSLGSVMLDKSAFDLIGVTPSKNIETKAPRKRWDKSLEPAAVDISGFELLDNQAPPLWDELSPPPDKDDFAVKNKPGTSGPKCYSSTPIPYTRSSARAISAQKIIPELGKKKMDKMSTKSKIPNFALIHQKNFQKMENIKEMVERKAKRAELLLSGQKPPRAVPTPKDSKLSKALRYSPKKQSSTKLETNIPKPTKSVKMKSTERQNHVLVKAAKIVTNNSVPKRKSIENQKNGFSKFGFKVGQEAVKKVTKEEQAKAVATKTKVAKHTLDSRRIMTQKVRSNRRFDLLMQMRNKPK